MQLFSRKIEKSWLRIFMKLLNFSNKYRDKIKWFLKLGKLSTQLYKITYLKQVLLVHLEKLNVVLLKSLIDWCDLIFFFSGSLFKYFRTTEWILGLNF